MPVITASGTDMTTHRFRPFRYVNGQVIVTDYRAWNKVRIESQKGNKVVVVADLSIVPEMQVVNHKGEHLFFNPKTIDDNEAINIGQVLHIQFAYKFLLGYDCNGTPALNHYTKPDYGFEPLMTSRVVREFNDMIDRFNLNITKLLK